MLLDHLINLIPVGIFTASILGSMHCVGMCGGLVLSVGKTVRGTVLYQVGRLLGYLLLGLIAGVLGERILQSVYLSAISGFLIAGIFFYMAASLWFRSTLHFNWRFFSKVSAGLFSFTLARFSNWQNIRAAMVGFFSAFLPCGWLYTFVLGAITSHSIEKGVLILFVFWLGTLPALIATPWLMQRVVSPLTLKMPKISALVLLLVGILTLSMKMTPVFAKNFENKAKNSQSSEHGTCHHNI